MRILFLSSIFPHASNRVKGTFNLELCRSLAREHLVRVIAPRPFVDVWKQSLRGGLHEQSDRSVTQFLGLPTVYPTYFYLPKIGRAWFGDAMWRSVQSCMQPILNDFRPDGIVSYWAHPDGEVGLRAARQIGVPSVVMVGGSDVLLITESRSRRAKVLRVLQESDSVVTVSEGLRRRVIDMGVPAERVVTIYQGINSDHFHPGDKATARDLLQLPHDRKLLLWVGRMVDVKGLDVLVAAVDQLRQREPNVLLLLVGDGPLRKSVLKEIQRRHLDQHVRWVGAKPQQDLPNWYRAADVFCLSSRSEGLPNVLRESLSCGCPFVSTDVGSVREIADPQGSDPFAELVPIGDSSAMSQAIEQVLQPSYAAATQALPSRSWDQTAAELASLVQHLRGDNTPSVDSVESNDLVAMECRS